MKKKIIQALFESILFALLSTGLTALLHYCFEDKTMTAEEVGLSIILLFAGWLIWTYIRNQIINRKK